MTARELITIAMMELGVESNAIDTALKETSMSFPGELDQDLCIKEGITEAQAARAFIETFKQGATNRDLKFLVEAVAFVEQERSKVMSQN